MGWSLLLEWEPIFGSALKKSDVKKDRKILELKKNRYKKRNV